MKFTKVRGLKGSLSVPGDKSISHRAIMLGALAEGTTYISHFLQGADCLSTISCFSKMGISITNNPKTEEVKIIGKGLYGLKKPREILDAGNSGTTTRLLSGILSGQQFSSLLTGDASIQKRPMHRIITPLHQMEASIESLSGNGCAPLKIGNDRVKQKSLKGITYISPIASAQVKSCVLLAGLYADHKTGVIEPALSRNHTELMLSAFGAKVETKDIESFVFPHPKLSAIEIAVPGDISSAAYFIAAAALLPHSEVLLLGVGINPSRDGILQVARQMGLDFSLENIRYQGKEAVADILVKSSHLKATTIEGSLIPTLIDEIPIIALMAACADGTTHIKDAAELKVKESNRLDIMVSELSKMGVSIEASEDGMIIHGDSSKPLKGACIDSHLDHRIAMTFAIAGLIAEGETEILHPECVTISYPDFYKDLSSLIDGNVVFLNANGSLPAR